MNRDLQALAESNRQNALRTIDLVAASLGDYRAFDPTVAYKRTVSRKLPTIGGRLRVC